MTIFHVGFQGEEKQAVLHRDAELAAQFFAAQYVLDLVGSDKKIMELPPIAVKEKFMDGSSREQIFAIDVRQVYQCVPTRIACIENRGVANV